MDAPTLGYSSPKTPSRVYLYNLDNKSKSKTLLSCMHQDYVDACNDILPDRWWKATKRG